MKTPEARQSMGSGQTVGAALRERREQLGWALPDVANWLRIRLPYLEALEAGRSSELPGSAYAIGFLKTYAAALGFDAEEMGARFNQETRGVLQRKTELTFPEPEVERSIPVSVRVAAGLVVVVAAYAGWYRMSDHQVVPPQHVPPVSEIMPGVTGHGTVSPQVASVLPEPGHAPQVRMPPVVVAPLPRPVSQPPSVQGGAAAPGGEGSGQSVPVKPPSAQAPAPVPNAQEPAPSVSPDAQVPVSQAPVSQALTIHATADSWVTVRDSSGHVVMQRVMKAGEIWQPAADAPEDATYRVTVGNAGGVTLSAGGKATGSLGGDGAVKRNVPISAALVQSGAFGALQAGADTGGGAAPLPVEHPQASGGKAGEQVSVPGEASDVSSFDTPLGAGSGLHTPKVHHVVKPPVPTEQDDEDATDRLNAGQLAKTPAGH